MQLPVLLRGHSQVGLVAKGQAYFRLRGLNKKSDIYFSGKLQNEK